MSEDEVVPPDPTERPGALGLLRAEIRERHLRLADLPRRDRSRARAAVALVLVLSLVVVAAGARWAPGSPLMSYGRVPSYVVIGFLLGLGASAALATTAAGGEHDLAGLAVRFGVALSGATLGARLIEAPETLSRAAADGQAVGLDLARWCGVAAVTLALLSALVPRRHRTVAAYLGAAPFLLALVAYLGTGSGSVTVDPAFIRMRGNADWPNEVSPRDVVGHSILDAGVAALFLVQVLALAGIIAATRAAHDLAELTHRTVHRSGLTALLALLGAKSVVAVLALMGTLPGSLPDRLRSVATDGAASWFLAAVLALLGVWFLLRHAASNTAPAASAAPAAPAEDPSAHPTAAVTIAASVVTAMLAVPIAAGGLAYSYAHLLRLLPGTSSERLGTRMEETAVVWAPWILAVSAVLLVLIGVVISWRRPGLRWRLLPFTMGLAVWVLPRAVTILRDLLQFRAAAYPIGDPVDWAEKSVSVPAWVDAVTFDVFLTVAMAGVLAWQWERRRELAGPMFVALLVVTLGVHSSSLLPRGLEEGTLFYLGLVFPVVYALALDSRELNRSSSRARRVNLGLASTMLVLAATALLVASEGLGPGTATYSDFGVAVLKMPLLVGLAAAAAMGVGARLGPPEPH